MGGGGSHRSPDFSFLEISRGKLIDRYLTPSAVKFPGWEYLWGRGGEGIRLVVSLLAGEGCASSPFFFKELYLKRSESFVKRCRMLDSKIKDRSKIDG